VSTSEGELLGSNVNVKEQLLEDIRRDLAAFGLEEYYAEQLADELSKMDEKIVRAFQLRLHGYTQKEIASALVLSKARVSRMFSESLAAVREQLRLWASFRTTSENDVRPDYTVLAFDAFGATDGDGRFHWQSGHVTDLKREKKRGREDF
jgi:hypothetical protein